MKEQRGTILVVEDDPELRFILCAQLRGAGFSLHEANDGYVALKQAAEHQPDLIIMDVGLPNLDGISTTRAMKADPRIAKIPIIMLTGHSGSSDVVRGLEAGAHEYLSKPFDMHELLARVCTLHRLATAHQELDRMNTSLEAEVDLKTRRLQILYNFMRDLHQEHERAAILNLVLRAVERITLAKRISVLLTDTDGETLVCECAIGIDPKVVERIRVTSLQGIAGRVFNSGKMLAARALGAPNDKNPSYDGESFLCTPLVSTSAKSSDDVLGVINVTDKPNNGAFSADDIDCVRSIADAAAIALDNARRREALRESVKVLLRTVGRLSEYRDEETTQHIERVTNMARILATELFREGPYADPQAEDYIDMLVQAAPMHDIGKVGIPDDILTKPGKLTDEEYQIMKTHTDIGRRVLSQALDPAHPVPLLEMCIEIAYGHHERFDGTGYPRRVKGSAIPLSARIIAVVDAYDAITSRRRYSKPRSHETAVNIVREESGRHFDPVIVEAFLRCQDQFLEVKETYAENGPEIELALPSKRS